MNPERRVEIRVGLGSCGIANGARPVFESLRQVARDSHLPAAVKAVGCGGACHREPLVEVVDAEGASVVYTHVTAQQTQEILRRHLQPPGLWARAKWKLDQWGDRWLSTNGDSAESPDAAHDLPDVDSYESGEEQTRIVLENCGEIDPTRIEEYRARGGYEALTSCVLAKDRSEVIQEILDSGLRGRGGAGFPTGRKWSLAMDQEGPKFVICNGDEGDPGAFMDRLVLESDPHRVVEGLAIAAWAIGAEKGFFYIRAEYPQAVRHIREAIRQAEDEGLLGQGILGSDFSLELEVREGAGAFVCGEETALIASLEGRRGMPRLRPPYPVVQGFRGRPTCINNVETLACVPWIVRRGSAAFAALGTESSKGTKVFSLAGKVRRGGLIEVPMGITLREIVEGLGGGIAAGRKLKAVQIGGPSGGCVPASLADTSVDYEALAKTGAIMGSGGLVVLDERDCMVDIARFFLGFTRQESCGKCTFCRVGTQRMLEILERLCEGKAKPDDLKNLEDLADRIRRTSLCGLGQTAPNPVVSALRYFRDEFVAHLEGRCPAGRCAALVRYQINDQCIGCTLCAQACPVGAIGLAPYEKHRVDDELCTRCDMCYQACEDDAVEIVSP